MKSMNFEGESTPESESPTALEQERAELAAMVERLARSPRLSNLLRYVGEKYFQGEAGQLREYNIATEVFGRLKDFDPGEDAIARVEAHRLRKKLKEYYDSDGKNNPVWISIPPGSYVPLFKHRMESPEVPSLPAPGGAAGSPAIGSAGVPKTEEGPPSEIDPKPAARRPSRMWLYAVVATGLIAAVLLLARVRIQPSVNPGARSQGQVPVANASSSAGTASGAPVRLLAGYSGQLQIDASGAVWGPDRYFEGGRPQSNTQPFTGRTNNPFLFQLLRTGEFSYHIPLKPGVYELHLYFVESAYGPGLGGGELSRTFSVIINGERLLSGFDIESDADGPNIADERIFKDIQPAGDGNLHIAFESERGQPILSALEIIPGIPHKQIPVRLTTQPNVYIDGAGQVWSSDNYFLGGQTSIRRPSVSGTPEPGLFATERYGHFTYAIPADPRSRYAVILHFAEFYFGPHASGLGGVGSRRFNVLCNGVLLLEDFDIYKEAGSLYAIAKTFRHLKPTAQGKLNLSFEPIANYGSISAIEVLDESQ